MIDVGGTSIKYALWNNKTKKISHQGNIKTPDTIEKFYDDIAQIELEFKEADPIGIGFSIPGAVNQKTGIIEGVSALPYIHDFPIQQEIEKRVGLKITLENDANCAALAELFNGVAQECSNIAFLVIGTGVVGAVAIDRKLVYGTHLFGGEFGMMIGSYEGHLSNVGTAVHLAERYNRKHETSFSGKEVLELVQSGDADAIAESKIIYRSLAETIYNLQFILDPEMIVIGGGVSMNSDFINNLQNEVNQLTQKWNIDFGAKIVAAKYHNDSNLIGSAYNFFNNISK